jgi:excisionase family DNA binding protein
MHTTSVAELLNANPNPQELPIMTTTHSQLLTQDEAAERLGVKPTTLAVWRTSKRYDLPYCKIGRNVRYKLADVEAFIEQNTVSAGDPGDRR